MLNLLYKMFVSVLLGVSVAILVTLCLLFTPLFMIYGVVERLLGHLAEVCDTMLNEIKMKK